MNAIIASQLNELFLLQKLDPDREILVQRPEGNDISLEFKHWYPWRSVFTTQPLLTRSILRCELMLEGDTQDWLILKCEMDKIVKYLQNQNTPFLLAYSGGKSIHLHIFFNTQTLPLSDDIVRGLEKYKLEVGSIVREFLADSIFKNSDADAKALKLDGSKIHWSGDSKGSMVRLFGCPRKNGGYKTLIDSIPEQRPEPGELPLRFPEKIELWDISFLKEDLVKLLSGKIKEFERAQRICQIETLRRLKLPCCRRRGKCLGLQKAEEGVPEGFRDNVAVGLISAYHKWHKLSIDEVRAAMQDWYYRCGQSTTNNSFTLQDIDYKISRIYRLNKSYKPCRFFRDAGLCQGADCRVMMKRKI